MILPGLLSLAFYRKRPTRAQIALGSVVTVLLSALLGYVSPGGPIGPAGSVFVAISGGLLLYFGILAYLFHRYPTLAPSSSESAPPDPEITGS